MKERIAVVELTCMYLQVSLVIFKDSKNENCAQRVLLCAFDNKILYILKISFYYQKTAPAFSVLRKEIQRYLTN